MKIKKFIMSALSVFLKVGVVLGLGIGVALAVPPPTPPAGPAYVTLTAISKHVDSTVSNVAIVLSDIALVAGIGFILGAFFKLHQHKLNPTQVPISQGLTLMLVGAGLLLFPTILPTATHAVFGTASLNKVGGAGLGSLINS